MSVTVFGILLIALGTLTTVVVEFAKKVLNGYSTKYNPQTIALISGAVVGLLGTGIYYAAMGIPFTAMNIVWMVLEALAVIIGSQVGYDKLWTVVEGVVKSFISK